MGNLDSSLNPHLSIIAAVMMRTATALLKVAKPIGSKSRNKANKKVKGTERIRQVAKNAPGLAKRVF